MESIHDKEKSPVLSEVIPTVASDDYALETVDERKLLRKIDWHVVPWLALLYLLNFPMPWRQVSLCIIPFEC